MRHFGLHRAFPTLVRKPAAFAGQAMVEFTLVILVVLLPLTFGIIEVGRGVWYWNELSQLSREGARWVVVTTTDGAFHLPGNYGSAAGTTYNVASCACPDTAVDHVGNLSAGIPRANLTVVVQQVVSVNGGVRATPIPQSTPYGYTHGKEIRVRVTYPYRPVVTSILNIPAVINLSAETTMQVQ